MTKPFRCAIFAVLIFGATASPVAAIPPPPPAQSGSEIGTYDCGQKSLTISQTWNYKRSSTHNYVIRIGGRRLSLADAKRLSGELARRGPFQAISVYCTDGGPYELAFYRYTPSEATLRVLFKGIAISQIR